MPSVLQPPSRGTNPPTQSGGRQPTSQVRYKTDDGHEFFVYAFPDMIEKYRKDSSVPLVDVVHSFKVYRGTGKGQPDEASKTQLEETFGSSRHEDAIEKILKEGEAKTAHRA